MDSKMIDLAMREQLPVVYDGRRYARISRFISWYDESGRRRLSVELKEGNTAYTVPADKVELLEVE